MKKKLTLSIDENFLPKAKRYARAHGISLSELIEETLKKLAHTEPLSFSERWKGRFKPARLKDTRYKALAARYL